MRKGDENKKATEITRKDKAVLALLGVLITESPEKVKGYLESFGVKIRDDLTPEELVAKAIDAIARKNERFNKGLAELIEELVIKLEQNQSANYNSFDEGEDHFDYGQLIGGAIGSISNAVSGQGGRKAGIEARTKTMESIFAWKTQQEQAKAAAAKGERQLMLLKVTGGFVLASVLIGMVFHKQIKEQLTKLKVKFSKQ